MMTHAILRLGQESCQEDLKVEYLAMQRCASAIERRYLGLRIRVCMAEYWPQSRVGLAIGLRKLRVTQKQSGTLEADMGDKAWVRGGVRFAMKVWVTYAQNDQLLTLCMS